MDDRTRQLLAMVGSALDSANMAYALLVEHLTDAQPDLIATDNPDTCQHPDVFDLETAGVSAKMCATCGVIPDL